MALYIQFGMTLTMYAAKNGHESCLDLLILRGANKDAKDEDVSSRMMICLGDA